MWELLKSKTFVFFSLCVIISGLIFSVKEFLQADRAALAFSICRQVSVAVEVYKEKNDENPQILSDLVTSGVITPETLEDWKSDLILLVNSSFVENEDYIFQIIDPRNNGGFIGVEKDGGIVHFGGKKKD